MQSKIGGMIGIAANALQHKAGQVLTTLPGAALSMTSRLPYLSIGKRERATQ